MPSMSLCGVCVSYCYFGPAGILNTEWTETCWERALTPSLILGPVFFSAWDYTILGHCIKVLGPQYSLIKPNMYLIIFIIADIISLVLQAVGGGGAAVQAQNFEDTSTNTHISESPTSLSL